MCIHEVRKKQHCGISDLTTSLQEIEAMNVQIVRPDHIVEKYLIQACVPEGFFCLLEYILDTYLSHLLNYKLLEIKGIISFSKPP